MKKVLFLLIMLPLLGGILGGCNSDGQAQKNGTVCLGATAISGALILAKKVDASLALTALPNCVEFAYDLLTLAPPSKSSFASSAFVPSFSHALASNAAVKLSDQYTYTGKISGQVYSLVFSNCSPVDFSPSFVYQIPYSLSMAPLVSIGERDQLKIFKSKTSEDSSFGALANVLFDQYHPPSQIDQTGTANLSVPPQKKIKATISATVSYKYGVARVDDNGKISYLPWFITDNAKPSIQVQLDPQNCG